jgi:penicillin amidase
MKIWRNQDGVAHVAGDDLVDLFYGMGFVHARDRGLQMILMRILGQGRAGELLDSSDEILGIDTFFRRMNWHGHMEGQAAKLTPENRRICQAYCDGANATFSEKRPWELKLVGYAPEPWKIEDILLLSRMMGYLTLAQSQGEMERLFVEMVQAGVSEDKLHELFPGILGGMDADLIRKVRLGERIVNPASLWNRAMPRMMASNNYAVSGKKTRSGKPILSNDPHLEINRLPNVWCEMVLITPDRWAMGASIPGAPGLPVGRNPDLAWSATYTFMDATDSWIEQCRNGKYFREPDQWILFNERRERILRKKKPPVDLVFYENEHGVLDGNPHEEGYCLATAWAPARSGPISINCLLDMWHAKTVEDGLALAGRMETSWNFIMADTQGNIGYQMSGLMPKRRDGISGFVPLPGWKPENDWQGFVDPADLPRCVNPETGYFVTANQDLNEYGKAAPINVVMGPYRSDRIATLLEGKPGQTCEAAMLGVAPGLTCEDIYAMHFDVYSTQAAAFMNILKPLLPDTPAARVLKDWDLRYTPDSKGAWAFKQFYKALHQEVFGKNGLGEAVVDFLDGSTGMFNDFYVNFDRILLSSESVWFGGKSREEIYRQAAQTALAQEPKTWGETRQVMLENIFFGGKLPRFLGFDRGPITLIGDLATPHQGQIYESAGRKTTFAPSYRMVTDLATDEIHTNMAGGPSDRRFSKWYCSDLNNWINGRYKTLRPDAAGTKLAF